VPAAQQPVAADRQTASRARRERGDYKPDMFRTLSRVPNIGELVAARRERTPHALADHSWYSSDEYQPLKSLRVNELTDGGSVILVDAFDPASLGG
jgi:hypothetical protein